MKILWSIFISVLVFYIEFCQCEDFLFDTSDDNNNSLARWTFSSASFVYGENLTELIANIEEDREELEMPEKFWEEFHIESNTDATGIWACMYHKFFTDRTPSITFSLPISKLVGNISLSYFIYGDGYLTVSSSNKDEIVDNCQNRPPEFVTTTTELTTTEETTELTSIDETESSTTEETELTTTTTPLINMTCNTENRQWNYATVDFIDCNKTICTGVSTFTVTFHFKDDFADEASEGFIFLEKIVATEHFPTPPTEPPGPTPSSTTTTTSTSKTTESTTESLSTSLIPGFLMTFLTTSALFLTT